MGGGQPHPHKDKAPPDQVRVGLAPTLGLAPILLGLAPTLPITYLDMATPPDPTAELRPTLGAIMAAYKSRTFRGCLKLAKARGERLGKFWQRLYWERIIRDERAARAIAAYIRANAAKWEEKYNR